MADVRAAVRADLRAKLRAAGHDDRAAEGLVEEIETLFLDATTVEDPSELVLPALLVERWRPELALTITSHRRGWMGRAIVGFKRRVLLPLNRWLFEYTLGNFRRQDRLNVAILACLERLAAENLRLKRELAERAPGGPGAQGGPPASVSPESPSPAGPDASATRPREPLAPGSPAPTPRA